MMKFKYLFYILALCTGAILNGCDDEVSQIGGSLSEGTLQIFADSLELEVASQSVAVSSFDSRSQSHLLGRLSSDEFGDLSCSFVGQMMAVSNMSIPDSIDVNRVDSIKMIFSMPRGQFMGDSLAPQQLTVYRLSKQLPSDIKSDFDPSAYYSSSDLLGKKTYTLSNLTLTDTVKANRKDIRIDIDLPKSFGEEIFTAYRTHPETFQWPETFNKFFPGIYVTRTFGSGCVANAKKVEMMLYYHFLANKAFTEDGVTTIRQIHIRDSVALFATAPEVLSSTNVEFKPAGYIKDKIAAGETILTSPGGFNARISFPAQTIVDKFIDRDKTLAVISGLKFTIPAMVVSNNLGLTPPPYLLMIKTGEIEDFFANNKVPDDVSSFYAKYSSTSGEYVYNNMREYILPLIESEHCEESDMDFTLIPVNIETQSYTYNSKTYTVVTSCTPYMQRLSMVRLDTSAARIVFTYSLQQLK